MNLILLYSNDFVKGTKRVVIKDRRYRHIKEIHRAKEGDTLCVGLVGGQIGEGQILKIDDAAVEMEVSLTKNPPVSLPVTLILSLPRPIVLKRVLLFACSAGVKKIYIINSKRVEKSFWKSLVLREEKIKEQLVLGLEQSKDTILPEVVFRPRFKPFVEDELPDIIKGKFSFVAHPEAEEECPKHIENQVVLAIGPEGGFIPYEIEKLISLGFSAVSIGQRILRVESVIPVLLGKMF